LKYQLDTFFIEIERAACALRTGTLLSLDFGDLDTQLTPVWHSLAPQVEADDDLVQVYIAVYSKDPPLPIRPHLLRPFGDDGVGVFLPISPLEVDVVHECFLPNYVQMIKPMRAVEQILNKDTSVPLYKRGSRHCSLLAITSAPRASRL
jgi:hypothetical protein